MAKFKIMMKDPDHSIEGGGVLGVPELNFIQQFVEWGEYITVEFDTTTKTARVVPVAESRSK